METSIPIELVEMLRQRRVIPFLGAGFSAGQGLPDWDNLLRQVTMEVSGVPDYDVIKRCCNGDHLQIAEYLFIKSDRSIGPLRHKLSTLLQSRRDCVESTPHVELVNLNPQQIYTTNYDEVIEQTYRSLNWPYAFVALPKHIAASNKDKTQVVKYHGDLRYDQSLVLTESSYYSRLEFESPMDLKFRSDLLGQSVLFVGYSFRDINIRIIWFKLMEMMRDVPEPDRPTSYIVRFEKNEVLEDLYRAVGIRTISLDPDGHAKTPDDRNKLLGRFMLELAVRMNSDGVMPQSTTPMFVSRGLLEAIQAGVSSRRGLRAPRRESELIRGYIEHASHRQVPLALQSEVDDFLASVARSARGPDFTTDVVRWAARHLSRVPLNCPGAAFAVIRGLLRSGPREELLDVENILVPWDRVWSVTLSEVNTKFLVEAIVGEVEHHRDFGPDFDIAYAADIAKRILDGTLKVEKLDSYRQPLSDALKQASDLYPAIASIVPSSEGLTDLSEVLAQVQDAMPEEDQEPF